MRTCVREGERGGRGGGGHRRSEEAEENEKHGAGGEVRRRSARMRSRLPAELENQGHLAR